MPRVRPIGPVSDDDELGGRRERGRDRRGVVGGVGTRRLLAFLPAALQHRDNYSLAETVALQLHDLFGLDGEDGSIAIDQREDDRIGHTGLRQRDNLIDGHRDCCGRRQQCDRNDTSHDEPPEHRAHGVSSCNVPARRARREHREILKESTG